MVSPENIRTKKKSNILPEDKGAGKRHEFSFYRGYRDYGDFPVAEYDYYGILGSLGFFNPDKYPKNNVMTHDINTTTGLHYYDMSKQKTPIDARLDTITPNLGEIARDYKSAELYKIQDFESAAGDRIKEKTHRILSDPIRKYQSQMLIDIRNLKTAILKNEKKLTPMERLEAFNVMNLNVLTLMLERLTDVLDYQEKIYTYEKQEKKALGKNCYVQMTLVDGAEPTKIDFTDDSYTRNLPSGTTINDHPRHNLKSLTIYFDSGTDVYFSTNKPKNSLETTVKLSNPPMAYSMNLDDFSIESINIRAQGANADVRILGLY